MYKKIAIFVALVILILSGCHEPVPAGKINPEESSTSPTYQTDSSNAVSDLVISDPSLETNPTESVSQTENTGKEKTIYENSPEDGKTTNESVKNNNQDCKPTWTEPVKPTSPLETKPQKPEPVETKPQQTQPKETAPTETTPTQPVTEPSKPEPTRPETVQTVPEMKPTEPTGCSHEWKAIHHKEKGHWKAGVVCDCGWTIYGNADELVSKWNAHSSSYPPEETLFKHSGYGSADEWVVDEPAYDEWACSRCGEPKP